MVLASSRTPPRRRRRSATIVPVPSPVLAVAVLLTLAVLAPGCAGSDGSDGDAAPDTTSLSLPESLVPTSSTTSLASPTTTAPPTPGVVVDSFAVRAPLTCSGPSYDATVVWAARGVAAATVIVDGTQVAGPVPSEGPFVVSLPCDGVGHAVALVVVGDDGSRVIRTQAVLPGPQD